MTTATSFPARHLAAEVLGQALADAREYRVSGHYSGSDLQKRAFAAAWLASSQARPWFDVAGASQSQLLVRSHWLRTAEAILAQIADIRSACGHSDVPSDWEAVLVDGVAYVADLRRRTA